MDEPLRGVERHRAEHEELVQAGLWPGGQEIVKSFPFYPASGVRQMIALYLNRELPFYKADGSPSNILIVNADGS